MNDVKTLRISILGFGTVGQGTWKHLIENEKAWELILGVKLLPCRASVKSLQKNRDLEIDPSALTTASYSIVDDPEIDIRGKKTYLTSISKWKACHHCK